MVTTTAAPKAKRGTSNGADHAVVQNGVAPSKQDVYIKHETLIWAPARVVEKKTGEASCQVFDGRNDGSFSKSSDSNTASDEGKRASIRTVKLKEYRGFELPQQNAKVVADLLDLSHLHEPGILYNLKERHGDGKPYTRAGDLIIAVNPFQWIENLYSSSMRALYAEQLVWSTAADDARNQYLEPHIYEVSALAYSGLAFADQNQSILITGESGSGKTETTKLLMHHIASIQRGPKSKKVSLVNYSGGNSPAATAVDDDKAEFNTSIQRILEANPLLEAFGNAATSRNDNSSRFGKYTQLQFDMGDPNLTKYRSKATCVLAGSQSQVYLLESSRVCLHPSHERTFHIFYQILAADETSKAKIWNGLVNKTALDFKYVGASKAMAAGHDASQFIQVIDALKGVGLEEAKIATLLRALCIVLQLGNIVFTDELTMDDRAAVQSTDDFSALSELMGISEDDILTAFTERVLTTTLGETYKVPISAESAKEACDAFSKEIYSKTFLWLVNTINSRTCAEDNYKKLRFGEFGVIGLLDIFGFESFDTNGFGQLCINYANEKLQQKAIDDIFRASKDEYDREGIPLNFVEFEDNEQVLKIMEGRIGIIALLNEECYRPKGNDAAFVSKVLSNYKASKFVVQPKRGRARDFGVRHYAGIVMYTAEDFVQSNQDTLPIALRECARNSANEILATQLIDDSACASRRSSEKETLSTLVASTTQENTELSFHQSSPMLSNYSIQTIPESNKERRSNFLRERTASFRKQSSAKPFFPKSTSSFKSDTKEAGRLSQFPAVKSSEDNERKVGVKRSNSKEIVGDTIFSSYQKDLSGLMSMLSSTNSRYLRCIKPNESKAVKVMDHKSAVEQLRSAGIVATAKLARAMFAKSLPNVRVRNRYGHLWDKTSHPSTAKRFSKNAIRAKLDCQALLSCALEPLTVSDEGSVFKPFAVGTTKTYFKKGALEYLESQLVSHLGGLAIVIQRHIRGMHARIRLERMQRAAMKIDCSSRIVEKTERSTTETHGELPTNGADPAIGSDLDSSTTDSLPLKLTPAENSMEAPQTGLASTEKSIALQDPLVVENKDGRKRSNVGKTIAADLKSSRNESSETIVSSEASQDTTKPRIARDRQALVAKIKENQARIQELEAEGAELRLALEKLDLELSAGTL